MKQFLKRSWGLLILLVVLTAGLMYSQRQWRLQELAIGGLARELAVALDTISELSHELSQLENQPQAEPNDKTLESL